MCVCGGAADPSDQPNDRPFLWCRFWNTMNNTELDWRSLIGRDSWTCRTGEGVKRGPRVLPVSQRRPVNPEGQTHVLGDTQVPPLLHPSSQKAGKRKRNVLVQIVSICWISQQQHKKALDSCSLRFHEDITMCKVVPLAIFKSSVTVLGGNTDTFLSSHGLSLCKWCFYVWMCKACTQDEKCHGATW